MDMVFGDYSSDIGGHHVFLMRETNTASTQSHQVGLFLKIDDVKLVYYSPTGTSKQVVRSIAGGIGYVSIADFDLTLPVARTRQIEVFGAELVIIGVPVYSGRVPMEATDRLQRFKGKATPVVLVVVYGNREYEDALLELKDLATQAGFVPVAGAAFIGEHSYSIHEKPIAHGRPDNRDKTLAHAFGMAVKTKLDEMVDITQVQPLKVPGNHPYRARSTRIKNIAPVTIEDICIKCGKCAEACPVATITIGDRVETDPTLCTRCTACVKICPTNARRWEHPRMLEVTDWLYTNFHQRKEPETYL